MANSRVFSYCLALFFCLISYANAAVYQTEDDHGNLTFSDIPMPSSQEYNFTTSLNHFNASNTTQAQLSDQASLAQPESSPTAASSTSGIPTDKLANYSISILSPADQTTFQNQEPITVTVQLSPNLRQGDQIQLTVDGKPYQEPQASAIFLLNDLIRGTHQIQARVLTTEGGQSLSQPITIYKHQPSAILNSGR